MSGGTHRQGNLTVPAYVAKKNRERGEGEVPLNTFTALCLTRPRKQFDPNKKGEQWINPCFGLKVGGYSEKFKDVNGPDSDPRSWDIDPEVAVLAGEGLRNGRLLIGDGSIPKKDIPKLSTVRASRTSSKPGIEHRPQPVMRLI